MRAENFDEQLPPRKPAGGTRKGELQMKKTLVWLALVFAVVLLPVTAQAAEPGSNFTLYAGWFYPEGSALDEDATYGAAYGYNFSDRVGINVQTGFFDVDNSFNNEELEDLLDSIPIGIDLWLVDFSGVLYPGGGNFGIFGGLGWATIDAELSVPGTSNDIDVSDDTFTFHAGVNYQWNVGTSFLIRPEARARWFDATDAGYDETQWETVVHFGWRF
jgi:opacity protein-like surface antigen